ncbi:hypothetical protein BDZ90DRAFT_281651 [Jaminaea rosea]|uniref:Uncharacterized protein n=1 Tax=Jaminaea rosea TaxID=1569628 RepID=A0A316UID8_9BASI|nr:hypothetical protein BDZ90DRAFT_281651 [Jaminaea rosea]PWN25042.1 hypothetical protein BDZ90DRAFT_281651 [Jaminaea rosea]
MPRALTGVQNHDRINCLVSLRLHKLSSTFALVSLLQPTNSPHPVIMDLSSGICNIQTFTVLDASLSPYLGPYVFPQSGCSGTSCTWAGAGNDFYTSGTYICDGGTRVSDDNSLYYAEQPQPTDDSGIVSLKLYACSCGSQSINAAAAANGRRLALRPFCPTVCDWTYSVPPSGTKCNVASSCFYGALTGTPNTFDKESCVVPAVMAQDSDNTPFYGKLGANGDFQYNICTGRPFRSDGCFDEVNYGQELSLWCSCTGPANDKNPCGLAVDATTANSSSSSSASSQTSTATTSPSTSNGAVNEMKQVGLRGMTLTLLLTSFLAAYHA